MTSVIRKLSTPINRSFLIRKNVYRHLFGKKHGKKDAKTVGKSQKTPAKEDKNWVSYGFDRKSQKDDVRHMHSTFFMAISFGIVGGGYLLFYTPDPHGLNWAHREAFLVLRQREDAGLPRVSPDLIEPGTITLPSDDDLKGVEIIV